MRELGYWHWAWWCWVSGCWVQFTPDDIQSARRLLKPWWSIKRYCWGNWRSQYRSWRQVLFKLISHALPATQERNICWYLFFPSYYGCCCGEVTAFLQISWIVKFPGLSFQRNASSLGFLQPLFTRYSLLSRLWRSLAWSLILALESIFCGLFTFR